MMASLANDDTSGFVGWKLTVFAHFQDNQKTGLHLGNVISERVPDRFSEAVQSYVAWLFH